MRIMLVTDAWDPQVNGVVRTMKRVIYGPCLGDCSSRPGVSNHATADLSGNQAGPVRPAQD